MDLDIITRWLGVVALVLSLINMLWTLINRGTKDISTKMQQYRTDLVDHDRRIQELESNMKHLPTKQEIVNLQLAVSKVEGHMGKMEVSVESMVHTVRRIDDYLRENAP